MENLSDVIIGKKYIKDFYKIIFFGPRYRTIISCGNGISVRCVKDY